jgi:hypothetical protein
VAGQTSGLGLLRTVLSQPQYASALPDPSGNFTLFAPTDAAFFDLLSTFSERGWGFWGGGGDRMGGGLKARSGIGPPSGPRPVGQSISLGGSADARRQRVKPECFLAFDPGMCPPPTTTQT